MHTPPIPDDPFALVEHPPLAAAGEAEVRVFGAPARMLALPQRRQRRGIPDRRRPVFQECRAEAIIRTEAVWRAPGMALTGNAFPFAARQLVLWATERRREPTHEMLAVACTVCDVAPASAMVNSMGAAGSIARSHVHLVADVEPFLDSLPCSGIAPAAVHLTDAQAAGCTLLQLDPPFPAVAVGIRGPAAARAAAMHHLLECRTTPSFNLVGVPGTLWLFPRAVETPAPHFDQALGGAELWGRWCFNDTDAFSRATSDDLEAALAHACCPRA
ncbi:MAG: hypothetical protein H6836_01270 [Planctomycetes bacterium]|nr:hypothetical protein [Planctomycetota bacterium]